MVHVCFFIDKMLLLSFCNKYCIYSIIQYAYSEMSSYAENTGLCVEPW